MTHAIPAGYVDISFGVDFERARERLNAAAGHEFRKYLEVTKNPASTDEQRREARETYVVAQRRYQRLRLHDMEEIERILSASIV